jgi:hypothetical protein
MFGNVSNVTVLKSNITRGWSKSVLLKGHTTQMGLYLNVICVTLIYNKAKALLNTTICPGIPD